MIHPPDPPRAPTPHKADFVSFIIDNPAFEEDDNELNDKDKVRFTFKSLLIKWSLDRKFERMDLQNM